jgi:hypothetical protein
MPQEFPNGLTQGMLNLAESAICSSLFGIEGRDTVGTLQNAAGPNQQPLTWTSWNGHDAAHYVACVPSEFLCISTSFTCDRIVPGIGELFCPFSSNLQVFLWSWSFESFYNQQTLVDRHSPTCWLLGWAVSGPWHGTSVSTWGTKSFQPPAWVSCQSLIVFKLNNLLSHV